MSNTNDTITNLEERRVPVEAARAEAERELEELRIERRRLAPAAVAGDPQAGQDLAGVDDRIRDVSGRLELAEEAIAELDRLDAEEHLRREAEEHAAAEARRQAAEEEASATLATVDDAVTDLAAAMRDAVRAAAELAEAEGNAPPEDGRGDRAKCDELQERVLVRLEGHLCHLREGDGDLREWMETARRGIREAKEAAARLDPRAPQTARPQTEQELVERRERYHEAAGRVDSLRQQIAGVEFDLGIIDHSTLQAVIYGRPIGYDGRGV